MKADEIYLDRRYVARVNGRLTTVRVDAIRTRMTYNGKLTKVYDVTNLTTGRRTTFRSVAKFRRAETDKEN